MMNYRLADRWKCFLIAKKNFYSTIFESEDYFLLKLRVCRHSLIDEKGVGTQTFRTNSFGTPDMCPSVQKWFTPSFFIFDWFCHSELPYIWFRTPCLFSLMSEDLNDHLLPEIVMKRWCEMSHSRKEKVEIIYQVNSNSFVKQIHLRNKSTYPIRKFELFFT